ncbi:MAG: hypothetical protein EOO30_15875 [Comamonadaceae bacterium]|nr:MAG: hypothetical protein EOO30_15875 [Comamonadaceae bacterium]
MTTALAASILDAVLGLTLASTGQDSGNRFALQGVTLGSRDDGAIEIGIARFEAASLRVASGPLVLEVGQLALHELVALVRIEEGKPRLFSLRAASAELSGVKVHGPLVLPPHAKGDAHGAWMLGPLAAANGTIRAEIVDAHLLFDADVTVPIREGEVEFKDATVEHVGPDSRMGASRLGLYVDAPNGRSYLYQFASTPVAGVEFERRGAMLGPWVTDRGKLHLQPFAEWLLRQPWSEGAMGITEQARLLFDRTRLDGELRLGDGKFAAPGVQAEVVGRAEGRNVVRVHSEAVGQGLHVDVDSLLARSAVLGLRGTQVRCDEVAGAFKLRLYVEDAQMQFAFDLDSLAISGLRLGDSLC